MKPAYLHLNDSLTNRGFRPGKIPTEFQHNFKKVYSLCKRLCGNTRGTEAEVIQVEKDFQRRREATKWRAWPKTAGHGPHWTPLDLSNQGDTPSGEWPITLRGQDGATEKTAQA